MNFLFFSLIFLSIQTGNEVVDFFNELMFGAGAWFGLILMLAICIGCSYRFKYSSTAFLMIMLFMSLNYMMQIGDSISLTNNFAWAFIISGVGCFVVATILFRDLGLIGGKK